MKSEAGTNTLLQGPTGSGKTYAIRTLIDAGITPFVLSTEPGIASSLGDLPPDKLHWHYIAPAAPDWADMLDTAKKINTMSQEMLCKATFSKQKYNQFYEVLSSFANFTCDRTGESYGSVDNWNTDRAIVVDSMSGLNIMSMDLVVGAKPIKSPGDWGIAMDNLERLINRLSSGTHCHFVLTSHLEREKDDISGRVTLMVSTLGQKLAPKIPRFFDNVILARKDVDSSYYWANQGHNIDLKTRHIIPQSEKLPPSFIQIIENWKTKGGSIEKTTVAEDA